MVCPSLNFLNKILDTGRSGSYSFTIASTSVGVSFEMFTEARNICFLPQAKLDFYRGYKFYGGSCPGCPIRPICNYGAGSQTTLLYQNRLGWFGNLDRGPFIESLIMHC